MKTEFHPIPKCSEDKIDILLINVDFAKNVLGITPAPSNHLGLNRLASYLEVQELKSQVLNTTGMSVGTKGSLLLSSWLIKNLSKYRVIGFYVTSWNISFVIEIIQIVSDKLEDVVIFLGGPLPSAEPMRILDVFKEFGINNMGLVQGYGEFLLTKALKNLTNLKDITGLWSWQKNKLTIGNLQRFNSFELDKLPFLNPKFNTFYQTVFKSCLENNNLGKFSQDMVFSALGLDVNQGCAYSCSYCSVPAFGRVIAEYKPQRVVDEIQQISTETGIFMYTFTNSNILFYSRLWILMFCNELLRRRMNEYIHWTGYHHPLILNKLEVDDFKLIKKAGCDELVLGIQSVEKNICKLFNRPENSFEILKEINIKAKEARLRLVIDYITDVPGENLEIIDQFYDYCINESIECRSYNLKLYPNTALQSISWDFSKYDLVPVIGKLAPELETYAFMPKYQDVRRSKLQEKLRKNNKKIIKNMAVRIGKYFITNYSSAIHLKEVVLPSNEFIPQNVKRSMFLLLENMLNSTSQSSKIEKCDQDKFIKILLAVNEKSPPVLQVMAKKWREELGEEKYAVLKSRYNV